MGVMVIGGLLTCLGLFTLRFTKQSPTQRICLWGLTGVYGVPTVLMALSAIVGLGWVVLRG